MRHKRKSNTKTKRGAKPKVTKEHVEAAASSLAQKTKLRAGKAEAGINDGNPMQRVLMDAAKRQRVAATGQTGGATLSISTEYRARRAYFDPPVGKPGRQTRRRAEAMGDVRNFVSAAAIARAMLYDDPLAMVGPIPASHLSNMDCTTMLLTTEGTTALKTYFFKGETALARKGGKQLQSVMGTKLKKEFVRVRYYCTSIASGRLCTGVYTLTVPGLKEMQRILV